MNLINFTGEETERKGRTMMRMLSSKIDFNGGKTTVDHAYVEMPFDCQYVS